MVGTNDFLDVLAAWGPNPGRPADFDNDDIVGITDFLELLANWGHRNQLDCADPARCQTPDQVQAYISADDLFTEGDNFVLSAPDDAPVNSLCWWGTYFSVENCEPGPDEFTVNYYSDDSGPRTTGGTGGPPVVRQRAGETLASIVVGIRTIC